MSGDVRHTDRFQRAVALIDAANADDPVRLPIRGSLRSKEIAHADLLTEWIERLQPDASEALLLAARAHHIRRWTVPRSTYPKGRAGYLRWRRDLHDFHARETAERLGQAGYDATTIERVQQIVRKERLKRDPEVQTLEDGLCLVFLETQLENLTQDLAPEKVIDVLRKTWRKMSPAGHDLALRLPLSDKDKTLLDQALQTTTPPRRILHPPPMTDDSDSASTTPDAPPSRPS